MGVLIDNFGSKNTSLNYIEYLKTDFKDRLIKAENEDNIDEYFGLAFKKSENELLNLVLNRLINPAMIPYLQYENTLSEQDNGEVKSVEKNCLAIFGLDNIEAIREQFCFDIYFNSFHDLELQQFLEHELLIEQEKYAKLFINNIERLKSIFPDLCLTLPYYEYYRLVTILNRKGDFDILCLEDLEHQGFPSNIISQITGYPDLKVQMMLARRHKANRD